MDAARRLERLQRKAECVEQADRLQFVARFQSADQHPDLDRQRRHQQHVVARDAQQSGARHEDDAREEQAGEQAGARLLDTEPQEFQRRAAPAFERAGASVRQARVQGAERCRHAAGDG